MAALSGKTGTVTTGVNVHLKVSRWSLALAADAVDATGMSDAPYRVYVPGLIGATLSFDAHWDTTGVTGRPPDITTDAVMTWQLETDSVPNRTFSGSMIVTGCTSDVALEGTVTYSVEATVTGAWVEV